MLKKRIISSAIILTIFMAVLFVDWLCALLITAFAVLGLYEFFSMLEHKGISIYKYVGLGIGAIIPLSIALHFELTKRWEFLFIVLALIFLILMQFRRRQNTGVIVSISTTLFGILYVSWFLSFLIKIRYLPGGLGFLVTVILITKLGDIGAYLFGMRLGKTPLIPRISPNKSVEGAIAGLVFSMLGALACRVFLPLSYLHLALLGLCLGVIGQLGDLSESLMKRDCQIKDSGKILSGLGGVLDFIDSLIFAAPVFYFYMSLLLF